MTRPATRLAPDGDNTRALPKTGVDSAERGTRSVQDAGRQPGRDNWSNTVKPGDSVRGEERNHRKETLSTK